MHLSSSYKIVNISLDTLVYHSYVLYIAKDLRWSPVVPHNLHGAIQIELYRGQHIEFKIL